MTASSSTSASAKPSKGRRAWRVVIAGAIFLVAAVVVAGAVATAAMLTAPGRATLVRVAEIMLSGDGTTVTIGALGPGLPAQVRVTDIAIADADGAWLTIAAAAVDWRPLSLLTGAVDITRVAIDQPDLARLPASSAADPGAAPLDLSAAAVAVRIESLTVEGGHIGVPVLGQSIAWRAAGGGTSGADGVWQGSLMVERTDDIRATAQVSGRFDTQRDTLDLDAALAVPPGGAIAGSLGLPGSPALSARIAGQGALADWRGELSAEATGVGRIAGDLSIGRLADAFRLAIDGRAIVATALPVQIASLALNDVAYSLTAQWDGADAVTAPAITLTTATARAELSGATDLARGIFDMTGTIDLAGWRDQTNASGPIAAQITAAGPWRTPAVDITAQMQDLQLAGVGAATADITARLAPAAGSANDLAITLTTAIGMPRLPVPLAGLVGPQLLAEAAGRLNPTIVEITSFSATGQHLSVHGNAEVDLRSGAVASAFAATLATLEPLSAVLPGSPTGTASLEGFVQRAAKTAPVTGTVALTVTDPAVGDPVLDPWLGDELVLTSDIVTDLAGSIGLNGFELASGRTLVSGALAITESWRQVEADFTLTGADLSAAAPLFGTPLAGTLSAAGQVTGPLADPQVAISTAVPSLAVDGTGLSDLASTITLVTVVSAPTGRVTVAGAGPTGAFDLATDIAVADDRVTLSAITARTGATRASGDLTIDLVSGLVTGAATGRIGDLGPWAALAATEAGGAAEFSVTADANGGRQRITVDVAGSALALSGTTMADSLDLTATAEAGVATIIVAAAGPAGGGFDVAATATGRHQADGIEAELTGLTGALAGQQFTLQAPAAATLARGRLAIDQGTMTVAGGTLSFSGALTEQNVDASMRLAGLPLATAMAPFAPDFGAAGELTIVAQVTGTRTAPQATADIDLTGAALTAHPDIPPVDGSARLIWRDGRLDASGSVTGIGDPLTFAAELPLPAPGAAMPADGTLTGRVAWRGEIAEIWDWVPLPDHRLSGDLRVDLAVLGQVSAPRFNGVARLAGGRYENLQTGTLLTDLEVTVAPPDASGGTVAVTAAARDGGAGTMTGQGTIDLTDPGARAVAMVLTFSDLIAIRRDEATATVAGELNLTPDLIAGTVSVAPAEIRLIASSLPPSVVDLEVADATAPTSRTPPAAAGAAPALDIRVGFPGRTFVRGRGLDSEWGGDIRVAGTTAAPIVSGALAAVRGDFTFAGTDFDVRDSSIAFAGTAEVDPVLDITAEHAFDDVTVRVRITGPASAPVIALQSSPSLPQDEIIARILFGADVASLSPLQVAQLGLAVAQLSGAGAGTGILDRLREVIGVDRLSVNAGDQGAEVTAGRYVGEAFVGVRQGTQPGTSAATVELEVLPNVTVESEVNSVSGPKTGVFWKRDY